MSKRESLLEKLLDNKPKKLMDFTFKFNDEPEEEEVKKKTPTRIDFRFFDRLNVKEIELFWATQRQKIDEKK